MKCFSNVLADCFALDPIKLLQNLQQVIEEFPAYKVVINNAVVLLRWIVGNSIAEKGHFQAKPSSRFKVNPHIEIAVNNAPWHEIFSDLKQRILRMRFKQKTPLTRCFRPALNDGDHNVFERKGNGVGPDMFDHLRQQWRMTWLHQVAAIQGEAGNQKAAFQRWARYDFPHQKSPSVVPFAEYHAQFVRKIGEVVMLDVAGLPGSCNAVANVQPAQFAIEARDVLGIMQLQEMRRQAV